MDLWIASSDQFGSAELAELFPIFFEQADSVAIGDANKLGNREFQVLVASQIL